MREELVKLIRESGSTIEHVYTCETPEVEIDGEVLGVVTRAVSKEICKDLHALAEIMCVEMEFLKSTKLFIREVTEINLMGTPNYKIRYAFK